VAEDRVEQARTPTDVLMGGMVFFLLWLVIVPTAAPLRARILPTSPCNGNLTIILFVGYLYLY
jgi:hypothetical protein